VSIDALKLTGLYEKRKTRAGELTLLDRKRLEIAGAGTEPKLLLLDEVAAGLTEAEVSDVMKMVADLKASGYTMVWIEHVIQTWWRPPTASCACRTAPACLRESLRRL
jgi:branched-chain amino acid transport system ATP-binding protein